MTGLRERLDAFGGTESTAVSYGMLTAALAMPSWLDGLRLARDELRFDFFDWLSAVDGDEFTVVTHLWSTSDKDHLLLRTTVPKQLPELPSAVGVYRGANWHEREVHEMFGITFTGHPNPIPLLLPDGFDGHPLRKDFALLAREEKPWPGAK